MLPEYFAERGYRNPGDAFNGPWQYGWRTDKHYWDWQSERPTYQNACNVVMSISRSVSGMSRGQEWFDFYPVEKLQGAENRPLLVDIGGGLGHDLVILQKHAPSLSGKMIPEDLPSVIPEVKGLPEGIELVGHDFFEPQPPSVKHAKAYYMRTVLHDWPDAQALQILEGIRGVMSTDSVLLINENVLPASNVPLYSAQLDLTMMVCFSSLDRTEKHFEELLDSAGFKLVKIWRPEVIIPGSGTLFEAVLKT